MQAATAGAAALGQPFRCTSREEGGLSMSRLQPEPDSGESWAERRGGQTALHHAALFGHVTIARHLLRQGAELRATDKTGATPLHYAAEAGQPEMVTLLVANGSSIHARDANGLTPLHYAARNGHERVVELLLASGAEVDAQDRGGCSTLSPAAARGRTEVLRIPLEARNDAREKGLDSETTLDEAGANTPMSPHSRSARSAGTASRAAGN